MQWNATIRQKLLLLTLLFFNLFYQNLGTAQKTYDRADFYINTNECVNCHMFLPNYAISLQNSDTLILHLDNASKKFGVKYLKSKGINISKFDTIYYEDLLKKYQGYFDSFIVISNNGKKDTVLVKMPLLLDRDAENEITSKRSDCGETSNRVTTYPGSHSFILVDYLFQQTTEYYSNNNKINGCTTNPFEIEKNTQLYRYYVIDHGISLDLTTSLSGLLVQLGKDKTEVISACPDKKDRFNACVKIPYVHTLSNGDTAIAGLFLIQSTDNEIVGILNNNVTFRKSDGLQSDSYFPVPSNGFSLYSDTLIMEFKKSNPLSDPHEKYIGLTVLNRNSHEFILKNIYTIESPSESKGHFVPLAFNQKIVYFKQEPKLFDLDSQLAYEFPVQRNSTWFEMYSASKLQDSDKGLFRLIYQNNGKLYTSLFDPDTQELAIQNELPMTGNQYAVPQEQGVFILSEGGPALPYKYVPYQIK